GKLKRDKNETFIFKNSDDNSYYEQIDGETVCIDDDLPFEIPDSWRWCRLSNICNYIQRGKSPKYTELKKYPVISQKCVRWSGLDMQPAKFIIEESLKKYEEVRFLRDNDILWNSTGTGTVGRATIYNSQLNPFNIAVADSHVTVLRPMFVESLYIYDFIMSPHIQVGFEDLCDGSTNQKELSLTTVSEFLIPLPPVDEQKRISEVVENIFLYLDNLESIIKGS
ncbi:MAG: restriction endonuclease subunit S, partial [Alphaproteobacteria bacterium]|nr:restriction endonuclease subunit S [Alphaproteobacteria bacterium]